MPRPGPRPYECVKRAWHSDRHQPIRGSLIQEIFRIVNENHSSATKKNKEWQEKLPIVVLKAEEIMYSKANSEAEYVDVNTLWDRANDAINTIIRRDESTETGDLLQPCIEAALHLGCTPRRSSRSQRNNAPRCYLNPKKPEALSFPLSNLGNRVQGNKATNCSFIPQSSKFLTTPTMNSSSTYINYDNSVIKKNDSDNSKCPFSPKNLSTGVNHLSPYFSSSCSVYSLHNYGNSKFQLEDSNFETFGKPNYNLMKADKIGVKEKHSSCGQDATSVLSQADPQHMSETPPESVCDLSLRLGPLAVPCSSAENSWSHEVDKGALESCKLGSKANGLPSQSDKNFSCFPKANAHDMLDCSATKWNHKTQNLDVEATLRKRKVAASHQSDDRQLCWPLKVPFEKFNGRISNANQ